MKRRRLLWGVLSLLVFAAMVFVVAMVRSSGAGKLVGDKHGVFIVRSPLESGTGFFVQNKDDNKIYGVTAFHIVAAVDRVVLEREEGEVGSSYTVPIYADIVYASPRSDLAILSFDLPHKFLGVPLTLADDDQLRRADGKVRVWGSKEDSARPGVETKLHEMESYLTSGKTKVRTLDVFTKENTVEDSDGFSISEGIPPEFSGSPAIASIEGNNVVIGVIVTRLDKKTGELASMLVAASEVKEALKAATTRPRPEDIDPKSSSGFDLRSACEKTLNSVIQAARSAPPGDEEIRAALLSNRLFGGKRYKVYDMLSPTSREFFFNKKLAERFAYNVQKEFLLYIIKAENTELSEIQGQFYNYKKPILPQQLAELQRKVGLDLIRSGGILMAIDARLGELMPLLYDRELNQKWGPPPKLQNPVDISVIPTVTLTEGQAYRDPRAGKQVVRFRYGVKGAWFTDHHTADFEFEQGTCGLVLEPGEVPITP